MNMSKNLEKLHNHLAKCGEYVVFHENFKDGEVIPIFKKITKEQLKTKMEYLKDGEILDVWLCPESKVPIPYSWRSVNYAIWYGVENKGVWNERIYAWCDIERIIDRFSYDCKENTDIYLEVKEDQVE